MVGQEAMRNVAVPAGAAFVSVLLESDQSTSDASGVYVNPCASATGL